MIKHKKSHVLNAVVKMLSVLRKTMPPKEA